MRYLNFYKCATQIISFENDLTKSKDNRRKYKGQTKCASIANVPNCIMMCATPPPHPPPTQLSHMGHKPRSAEVT